MTTKQIPRPHGPVLTQAQVRDPAQTPGRMVRKHGMRVVYSVLAVVTAGVAGGCGVEVRWIDPEVDSQDEGGYVLEGEPRLELGYYREQLYIPIGDGDECAIVANPQGGFWTSPTIRAGGIAAEVRLRCTLTAAGGETLSDARERRHLVLSPEGLIEATNFPMFVERLDPDDEVEALFGSEATLQCTLTDETERAATLAVDCILEPGTG